MRSNPVACILGHYQRMTVLQIIIMFHNMPNTHHLNITLKSVNRGEPSRYHYSQHSHPSSMVMVVIRFLLSQSRSISTSPVDDSVRDRLSESWQIQEQVKKVTMRE